MDVSGAPSATSPGANGATTLTHGTNQQTVIYTYRRKNAGNVLVHHYENGTTTSVSADENLSGVGKLGLTYTTSPASVANYTVVSTTPTDHTGNYPASGTTVVTYYYTRDDAGDVTVHHYEDGTTTPLMPDITISGTGKLGLPYTTTEHNIPNFTLVAQPVNKNGTYTVGNQEVTYFYRRNDAGNVIVHHYENGTTTSIAPDENLSGVGKLGLTYSTSPANIPNYTVVNATPTDHTGNYPASGTTVVTYLYTRNDAEDVTVKYLEQGSGTPLDTDDVLNGAGKLGLPYTTTEKNIPNYELVAQPVNKNGTYSNTPQTVIYEYRRMAAGDVTSVYVDDEGNEISTPDVQSGAGKLGLPYTTTAKTIPNFTLVSVPSNANGTFTSGPQTVTYLYKRKQSGGVKVNYLDNYGNRIETTDTIAGSDNVGLPYTTSPKTIQYYDLITVPANANGTFTVAPITVDYIYKRQDAGDVVIEHIDENGNVPLETPEVLDGTEKLGMPYTSSVKAFENFDVISVPSNANGTFGSGSQTVTYVYRRKDAGDVIAHYVDTAWLPIESDEILDGTRSLGLPYATNEKDIEGYTLYLVQGSETGVFTSGTITVTYVYKKNPGQVIIPQPVVPSIPVTPGIITPGTPGSISPIIPGTPGTVTPVTPGSVTPIIPGTPGSVTPLTPDGTTPSRIATPSQINRPGDRYQDLVIRPTATPSIATSSNGSRGGSSSGGNSTVRPGKAVTVDNGQSKNGLKLEDPIIDKPNVDTTKSTPQKATLTPNTRIALSVPKTEDAKDMRGYIFALITSLTAAIIIALKKKEKV